ncbi:MAG: nicotinate (nicotinamide) nucleotide adenylyltransferase [Candidatus Kapabacteria bacterium]|jgi:nicotinate-nucleotide adenylyltransferase|nr:nicotinate (nicotinamide) nucleotide adenylyltransferase [Candidatus Kapabacteria bacterium]
MKSKIGLIGGSFNPIHKAHIAAAECFLDALQLDKCVFMPTNISPFKTASASALKISAEHRLECVRLALKNNPKLEISSYEIDKGDISYTYETILYLKNKYPDSELFFLIGGDSASHFRKWRNWEKILNEAQICIVPREDKDFDQFKISEELTIDGRSPIYIKFPLMNISSTEIRNLIKSGQAISDLVPPEVEDYIITHRLYQ